MTHSLEQHLKAAQGYMDLGMFLDANAELEQIEAASRHLPEVLEIRVRVYSALEKWDLMLTMARRLALEQPDDPQWRVLWAYAARYGESIEAGRIILVNAVTDQPDAAVLHFNLAGYECQLRNLQEAKERLRRAFELDEKYRLLALEDQDLEPLWESQGK
jgi:tetratricopeptide (TPR) repeat protein